MLSGKSTVLKHFGLKYRDWFTDLREGCAEIIRSNTLQSMQTLCRQMTLLQDPAIEPFVSSNMEV